MFRFNKAPGQKILELGGGDSPHPDSDIRVDVRAGSHTHFTADFNEPLLIGDGEFDAVICKFAIEHLSWRKVRQFVKEMCRVLKPEGTVVIVTANTKAQFEWINTHTEGWDGKDAFDSCSCIVFGDNDYPENSHRAYFDPDIATSLFVGEGFENIVVVPYGERATDLLLTAKRPKNTPVRNLSTVAHESNDPALKERHEKQYTTKEKFDKHYFHGGAKVGGYAGEGYRDFPVHEITFRELLKRQPTSVLELGCARGFILKRLQDRSIRANGLEVSRHAWMTRACDGIINFDITEGPWPFKNNEFDLCFSMATLEHVPEDKIAHVLSEMKRTCARAFHGIDFGTNDDGFDKTHVLLKPNDWWFEKFNPLFPFGRWEFVDKEVLEKGEFPQDVLKGDGKIKLNAGSFTTQYHYGWQNIDIVNLSEWSSANGYGFLHLDVRNGLPHGTNSVDAISTNHFLEHLTYDEGLAFLRECRRVMKLEGCLRIAVPDTRELIGGYSKAWHRDSIDANYLSDYTEISDGVEQSPTDARRLWSLLLEGHKAIYDADTLQDILRRAGFHPEVSKFRDHGNKHPVAKQIQKECLDVMPEISLYVNAYPHD